MSIIRERFKLSTLSLAVLSSMSMQAFAFEEESKAEENIEVIEVEGFRGSLIKSMNNKRNSTNVSDAIFAEDIGKTSDQNIADALGRVTGVSIISRDGEGSAVSVRGASSTQNQITLNGQQLSSTDFNQSVDLSSFSADILSKLEVVKTPSADHDEGSLGASVNLITIRPLDVSEETLSGTLQGRYNDLSEETDYKVQVSLTEKFLDETLGVALTVSDETNSYRKDQYLSGDFEASNLLRVARDQNGDILSDVRAVHASNHHYRLNRNTSDRLSASLGIQYLPGDDTELMFNATYSKQTRETQYDGLTVRTNPQENFIEGLIPDVSDTRSVPAPLTDPTEDWTTIDTSTNSLIKRIQRFAVGDIQRSVGGTENENLALTLNIQHQLTDSLAVSGQIGVSDSTSESLPSIFSNLQNFRQVPTIILERAGAAGQPVGYDCTSGQCEIIAGTALIDVGEQITDFTDRDGITQFGWTDNTNVLTGFNPADANTFSLGNFSQGDTTVEDTIKSAQIDFDYDLDTFGITTIEFGAKITSREKSVDDQDYTFNSITKSGPITNAAGINIGQPAGPLSNIRAVDILDPNGLGIDDFMSSLGIPASHITRDAVAIDVRAAFDLVSNEENLVRNVDDSKSRAAELDTKALYFKTNFSFFDDALTGDIGVRYVETEIKSSGFSGGRFHDFPDHADETEFDWLTLRNLRDRSLPACPAIDFIGGGTTGTQVENKFGRIDGTGWQTNGSLDPVNWTRMPMFDPNGDGVQDACHDTNYADWADAQREGRTFTGDPINWGSMWRYADVSASNDNGWNTDLTTPNVAWDGTAGGLWKNYVVENTVNKSITSFASADSYEYDNVLPSLNLNYALSDELVARFAISRTMTRPELEDTRAGFSFEQLWATYWGKGGAADSRDNIGRGTVDLFNTRLDPLESDNLDLSLEWYFNDASMVSVAFFKKDMKNFVDTESISNQYVTDLRNIEGSLAIADLILNENTTGLDNCQPVRSTTEFGFKALTPLVISDDLKDICHMHTINRKFNGDSAKIEGVELSYSQVYDFLPGFLSGLGIQANYTYQDSEYAPQESTLIPGTFLPSVPVADTPKHSYNASVFWEQDGHQLRLSYRASSDSLVGVNWNEGQDSRGRTWNGGSLWNEGRETFDLSATYQISEDASLTFQAINLFDEDYRVYYTSRELEVDKVISPDGSFDFLPLHEGNPLEGDATKSRTYDRYKVGSIYRLGLRVNF